LSEKISTDIERRAVPLQQL